MDEKIKTKKKIFFDFFSVTPDDHGELDVGEVPKFFFLEHNVLFISVLLLLLSVGIFALMLLGILEIINTRYPAYHLWPILFVSILLGLGGVGLAQFLSRRNINNE